MFVAYCRLCRHYRNLAEGGCVLWRFHFTRCATFWAMSLVGIYPGRASLICEQIKTNFDPLNETKLNLKDETNLSLTENNFQNTSEQYRKRMKV